ncbi:MAG: hypothetical protein LBE18_10745 [Planctomycetaceae bacterium]|jgi:hypothetical protein|nr:hypothetical protein [Planctomycetaceae bacterium]
MKKKFAIVICVALIVFVEFQLFSCSRVPKRPDDLPPLTSCVVSVTFGDEIMEGVGILMTPEDKNVNKWSAGGITNKEGKATMITSAVFTGVVPGKYIISFKKNGESVDMNAPPSLIPQKYITGKSKEIIDVTTDKSEYVFTLEGLKN